MSSLDGDTPCYECFTEGNIVWFTDDDLWNRAIRSDLSRWSDRDPILCVPCFARVCQERGYDPARWRLAPSSTFTDVWHDPAVREAWQDGYQHGREAYMEGPYVACVECGDVWFDGHSSRWGRVCCNCWHGDGPKPTCGNKVYHPHDPLTCGRRRGHAGKHRDLTRGVEWATDFLDPKARR